MLNGATGAAGGGAADYAAAVAAAAAASGVSTTAAAPGTASAAATAAVNNRRRASQQQPGNRHGSLAEKVHGSEVIGHLLVVRAECLPRALPGAGSGSGVSGSGKSIACKPVLVTIDCLFVVSSLPLVTSTLTCSTCLFPLLRTVHPSIPPIHRIIPPSARDPPRPARLPAHRPRQQLPHGRHLPRALRRSSAAIANPPPPTDTGTGVHVRCSTGRHCAGHGRYRHARRPWFRRPQPLLPAQRPHRQGQRAAAGAGRPRSTDGTVQGTETNRNFIALLYSSSLTQINFVVFFFFCFDRGLGLPQRRSRFTPATPLPLPQPQPLSRHTPLLPPPLPPLCTTSPAWPCSPTRTPWHICLGGTRRSSPWPCAACTRWTPWCTGSCRSGRWNARTSRYG